MKNSKHGFALPSVILSIVLVAVIAGGLYFFNLKFLKPNTVFQPSPALPDAPADVTNPRQLVTIGTTRPASAFVSVPLLDFEKTNYDAAIKTDKLIVLYFYANWCPLCKAEFPIMQKVFAGMTDETTKNKVIGFRVNYQDNETDADEENLAREFGVSYQHTKVFVKNGQRILKSPESWDERRYLTEINKSI